MFTVRELFHVLKPVKIQGNLDTPVWGLAYDSRQVKSGYLFVARRGFKEDGHQYIPAALQNGAGALVVEREECLVPEIPGAVVEDARQSLAALSAFFYGYPSHSLTVVGVTGTKGKTTTTHLIEHVLTQAGIKTGLIGTLYSRIGEETVGAKLTTPESLDLQKTLAAMKQKGATHVVMEVASHAIELSRVDYVRFAGAAFTNLGQDHLDFHETRENYRAAKIKLFTGKPEGALLRPGFSVINMDDRESAYFLNVAGEQAITYGLQERANIRAKNIDLTPAGAAFTVATPEGHYPVRLKLHGLFSVYNALCAFGVCRALKIPPVTIVNAFASFEGVPGRFEKVDAGQNFAVLVDFAHTPDSLENALKTARGFTGNKLRVVFGCGGDRDRSKRPVMGRIAGIYADDVVVTSDNPRSEEPEAIIAEIMAGLTESRAMVEAVTDRREAIRRAISRAEPGDVVLIAGKGHETYQIFKNHTIHFDDREEARAVLKELGYPCS